MTWHFFDKTTGLFMGRSFHGPKAWIEQNTPPDALAVEGDFDPKTKRLNPATGELSDWQAPPDEKRISQRHRMEMRRRITLLEAKQARALRELALGKDEAKERLQAIDTEITEVRAQLHG